MVNSRIFNLAVVSVGAALVNGSTLPKLVEGAVGKFSLESLGKIPETYMPDTVLGSNVYEVAGDLPQILKKVDLRDFPGKIAGSWTQGGGLVGDRPNIQKLKDLPIGQLGQQKLPFDQNGKGVLGGQFQQIGKELGNLGGGQVGSLTQQLQKIEIPLLGNNRPFIESMVLVETMTTNPEIFHPEVIHGVVDSWCAEAPEVVIPRLTNSFNALDGVVDNGRPDIFGRWINYVCECLREHLSSHSGRHHFHGLNNLDALGSLVDSPTSLLRGVGETISAPLKAELANLF